jgi:hypothetical protein
MIAQGLADLEDHVSRYKANADGGSHHLLLHRGEFQREDQSKLLDQVRSVACGLELCDDPFDDIVIDSLEVDLRRTLDVEDPSIAVRAWRRWWCVLDGRRLWGNSTVVRSLLALARLRVGGL